MWKCCISLVLAFCAFIGQVASTELSPWFGNVLELDLRASATANAYRLISTGHGTVYRNSCDIFYNLSASLAYPEDLTFELEAVAVNGSHHGFGMDSLLFTARQRWMNDITAEDPISLTGGLTVAQIFKPGLRNLSAFHHGGIQFEAHVAAGKEFSCNEFWVSRLWGVLGFGVADMGSPWIRGNAFWEHNWWNNHRVQIFMRTLWGLGHNDLNLCHTFHGYGPINHQSIDLGASYGYLFDCSIMLSLEYGHRVYARNCPRSVDIIAINLYYPLGF